MALPVMLSSVSPTHPIIPPAPPPPAQIFPGPAFSSFHLHLFIVLHAPNSSSSLSICACSSHVASCKHSHGVKNSPLSSNRFCIFQVATHAHYQQFQLLAHLSSLVQSIHRHLICQYITSLGSLRKPPHPLSFSAYPHCQNT